MEEDRQLQTDGLPHERLRQTFFFLSMDSDDLNGMTLLGHDHCSRLSLAATTPPPFVEGRGSQKITKFINMCKIFGIDGCQISSIVQLLMASLSDPFSGNLTL